MPFVDAGGTRLFHRFDGPIGAPPLVLSNSLGTNLGMWDGQMPALVERFLTQFYGEQAALAEAADDAGQPVPREIEIANDLGP